MGSKKKNDLCNSTNENPYDNYHGHQNNSGQNLDNSQNAINKDSNSKKRNKNK